MGTLGNILWFIFGGFAAGLSWVIAGIGWCITIIGIPIACSALSSLGLHSSRLARKLHMVEGR